MKTPEDALQDDAHDVSFTGVSVYDKETVFVLCSLKPRDGEGEESTKVLRGKGGDWGAYEIRCPATSLCTTRENEWTIYTLAPDGYVHIADPTGFRSEWIDETDGGPSSLRSILCIREIAGDVYASGMMRIFYERAGEDQWLRKDNGARDSDQGEEFTGFFAFDGFSSQDIFACGGKEIWRYDGARWSMLEIPATHSLNDILCAQDGSVYACGQGGEVLRRQDGRWSKIRNDETKGEFWGIAEFSGRVFVADNDGIYCCQKDRIESVASKPSSFLHANDGILWSAGNTNLMWSEDGENWTEVYSHTDTPLSS